MSARLVAEVCLAVSMVVGLVGMFSGKPSTCRELLVMVALDLAWLSAAVSGL